jgi:hypothetical protein
MPGLNQCKNRPRFHSIMGYSIVLFDIFFATSRVLEPFIIQTKLIIFTKLVTNNSS